MLKRFLMVSGMMMLSGMAAARAATIVWSTAVDIAGDSDVLTTGTLVDAFNIGSDNAGDPSEALATTINGVNFQPWAIAHNTTGNATNGNFQVICADPGLISTEPSLGSASAPYASLNADYKTMLGTAAAAVNPTPILGLRMNALTIGQTYTLQLWTNDSAAVYGGGGVLVGQFNEDFMPIDSNTDGADGGTGQYIVGTFVADDVFEAAVLFGDNAAPVLNGFQLRTVVPEPSSLALVATGAGMLLRRLPNRSLLPKGTLNP